jgi:flagellar hook-length control protein FliK
LLQHTGHSYQPVEFMIHILSSVTNSANQQGMLAALPAESTQDLAAIFTQALSAQFSGESAPLVAAADAAITKQAEASAELAADTDVAAAFLAMLGLPVAPKGESVLGGKAAASSTLIGVEAKAAGTEPAGKKLPNQAAVVAGVHQQLAAKTDPEAKPDITAALAVMTDKVAASGVVPIAVDKSIPSSVPVASVPQAGHEAAILALRGQAVATPDKAVIGMQSQFGSAAWTQELGDRMVWLAGQRGQTAELVLNPPSLGAVEVRIQMSGSDASAQFFSANPVVRETLEAALPKLREMLDNAGISLGDASVSQQSLGRRDQAGEEGSPGRAFAEAGGDRDGQAGLSASTTTARLSLLDYYA